MSSAEFHEAPRSHVADDVYEQLAAAILRGELAPGSAMPPERVLVERFGVSRMIARQAVHRLAELGLVRVKQGGTTIVLDPNDATDLRVLALFYKFAPTGGRAPADVADMIEKQYLQGLSIVEVASRRASAEDIAGIDAIVREADSSGRSDVADLAALEERFWRALAAAAKNRVFRMEVAWWYDVLKARPVPPAVARAPRAERIAFYRELLRRLSRREHAVEFYMASVRPILEALHPALREARPPVRPKSTRRSNGRKA